MDFSSNWQIYYYEIFTIYREWVYEKIILYSMRCFVYEILYH